jgi:hypothetical protein
MTTIWMDHSSLVPCCLSHQIVRSGLTRNGHQLLKPFPVIPERQSQRGPEETPTQVSPPYFLYALISLLHHPLKSIVAVLIPKSFNARLERWQSYGL